MIFYGRDKSHKQRKKIEKKHIKLKEEERQPLLLLIDHFEIEVSFVLTTKINTNRIAPKAQSGSRSDRGAIGMDFLELRPKLKKRVNKRKHSHQNTNNSKSIEIEEKDMIHCSKNKVSFEKVKRTVIYDKVDEEKEDRVFAKVQHYPVDLNGKLLT
jgi:hypothetical protein